MAISLDETDALYYDNRASAYHDNGNYKKAIEDYTSSIDLFPNDPESYYFRAQAKFELDKNDEGCLDLQVAAQFGLLEAANDINQKCK